MSVETYNIKEQWIGTADTNQYTFDFKIQLARYILIILQDNLGKEVSRVRGDDTTVLLSSITFDAINGGGTMTLIANLPQDYVLTALLANDYPTQPSVFRDKGSFTLSLFEQALDYVMSPIQRLAYLTRRSVKLSDLDDITTFDPTLPPLITTFGGYLPSIKDDGTGLELVVSKGMITSAAAQAAAAAASAIAAAASAVAAAASAIAAANNGVLVVGAWNNPQNITAAGITPPVTSPNRPTIIFVHGVAGPTTVTANPRIAAGAQIGQLLTLIGADDVNTLILGNGNGLSQNGDITLGLDDSIDYVWNGSYWSELSRRR